MSLAYEKMQSVVMQDGRLDFDEQNQKYIIAKPGEDVSYKEVISSTSSITTLNFSAPPPSPAVVVDRRIYLKLKFTMEFTGTSVGSTLLQIGSNDALRSFPVSRCLNSLRITINNTTVSTELSDYFHALIHYNTDRDAKEFDYGTTPHMLDAYQNYNDYLTFGSAKNCLANYGENGFETPRGGFSGVNVISDDGSTATVEVEICEPLFLNPLMWERYSHDKGFIGVQTFDLIANLESDLGAALWSHSSAGENITNINVSLNGNPSLLFTYITPDLLDMPNISDDIVYPYYNIDRYITNLGSVAANTASNNNPSNNIQLNSIPKRVYIYARRRNADRTFATTDTFARIDKLQVSFNNKNGLFSNATTQQLYQTSVRNGLHSSWDQWNRHTGSVFCIDFGKDVGLSSMEAPGLLGTYNLFYNIDITNVNQDEAINFDLYTVVVSEGTFSIAQNRSISQIGVISKQDVINSPEMDQVHYDGDLSGGNFLSGLKKASKFIVKHHPKLKQAAQFVRKVGPVATDILSIPAPRAANALREFGKAIDSLAKLVGLGYTRQEAEDMLKAMGYQGGDYLDGRGFVGGARVNRKKLKMRSRN